MKVDNSGSMSKNKSLKTKKMKGIIVEINGFKTVFGPPSPDGGATFIISLGKGDQKFRIDASSYDHQNDITYDWIKESVNSESAISIQFLDHAEEKDFSEPINKRYADPQALLNKKKVEYYHSLKKELEEKGLL